MGLTVAIVIAIVGVLVWYFQQQKQGLTEHGAIISRDADFVRQVSVYASFVIGFDDIVAALGDAELADAGAKGSMTGGVLRLASTAYEYEAQLQALDDVGNEHRYRLAFTRWTTSSGLPKHAMRLNALVTAVEKALVTLDPLVTVRTSYQENVTSKSRIV